MSKSNTDLMRSNWLLKCLTAVLVLAAMSMPISAQGVLAQDSDTQRPLPLPTNDLPDMSQQLELLRKLRSVMQSRENASKAGESEKQQPAKDKSKSSGADSKEGTSGGPTSRRPDHDKSPTNETNKPPGPQTDPEQLSRLQDALKSMSDRLPKDFVPPSLDTIPKEDLKKALENPAIRKTMQEMLRQFARDGVIPPPAPSDSSNSPSPRLPVPPLDKENLDKDKLDKENREERSKNKDSDRDSSNSDPLKNDRSDRDTREQTPDSAPRDESPQVDRSDMKANDAANEKDSSTSPLDEPSPSGEASPSDSAESNPVPPSSLKSLQDFMKKLASQSPSDGAKDASGPSGEMSPSQQQQRSGPLRRRDSSRGPQRPGSDAARNDNSSQSGLPSGPSEQNSSTTNPLQDDGRQTSNGETQDTSPAPQTENSGSSSIDSMSPDQNAGSSFESQQKALKALQDVMQEMEREQQAARSGESSSSSDDGTLDGSIDSDRQSNDAQSRQSQLELLKDLMQPDSSGDAMERNDNSNAASEDDANGSISEADRSFVREFLQKELERMSRERAGNAEPSESSSGEMPNENADSVPSIPNTQMNPPRPNRSGQSPNSNTPQEQSNSGLPRSMNSDPSRPTNPRSFPFEMLPQQNDSQPGDQQPPVKPPGSQPSENNRVQPSMKPPGRDQGETQRSAKEIQQELERRGVVDTLKKTWEKSIQEARTKRQQELQKQAQSGSNSNSSPPGLAPNDPAAMQSQLESLAKQLRDNPNTEKAISDMIGRVAKDMAEQSKSKGSETNGSPSGSFVQTPSSSPSTKANSEFPGQSMLKGLRESMSKMLSSPDGPRVTPSSSSGGGSSLSTPSLTSSFDFTPVLILAGILAAVALGFYALRAVRHHQGAEAAFAGSVPPIQPSQITTRADIVRAFHEMARKSTRSVQAWWTHRKVEIALTGIAPEKKQAVETLVETYEQARYLPQDHDLSPDQIQSARSALQQLQPQP